MHHRTAMSTSPLLLLLVLLTALACDAASDGAKLLPNGNFETPPKATDMNGKVIVGKHSLPEWKIKGRVEYISAGDQQGDMLLVVPHHGHAVRLGNEGAIIQRIVGLHPGFYYAITLTAARTCAQAEHINVSVAPFSGNISIQTIYSSDGWDTYAWAFKALASNVHLSISNPGSVEPPACGPLLDGIAINQLAPPLAIRGSLIRNGGFEAGPRVFHSGQSGVLIPPGRDDATSALPGWLVESERPVKYVGARHFTVPKGGRAVELVAGREGVLTQFVRTSAGKKYRLSFIVGDGRNACVGPMAVEVAAARNVSRVSFESHGTGASLPASLDMVAVGPISRVAFSSAFYHTKSDSSGSMCGPVLDQVTLFPLK